MQVADFGMSLSINMNMTHISGVHHGTPFYIAPEILRQGKASKASDVYSFGIMLWEMLHGTLALKHITDQRPEALMQGGLSCADLFRWGGSQP